MLGLLFSFQVSPATVWPQIHPHVYFISDIPITASPLLQLVQLITGFQELEQVLKGTELFKWDSGKNVEAANALPAVNKGLSFGLNPDLLVLWGKLTPDALKQEQLEGGLAD